MSWSIEDGKSRIRIIFHHYNESLQEARGIVGSIIGGQRIIFPVTKLPPLLKKNLRDWWLYKINGAYYFAHARLQLPLPIKKGLTAGKDIEFTHWEIPSLEELHHMQTSIEGRNTRFQLDNNADRV